MKHVHGLALVMVLLLISPAISGSIPSRALLAPEVPLIEFRAGDVFDVVGRYQSMLGTDLTMGACSIPVNVPRDSRPELFRRENLRELLIQFTVEVVAVENKRPRLTLLEARAAGPIAELFARIDRDRGTFSTQHARAVALWVLAEARQTSNRDLEAASAEMLFETLETSASAMPTDRALEEQDLDWFLIGQEHLKSHPSWTALVVKFANIHRKDALLTKILSGNGYLPTASGWRLRSEFLDSQGLVDHEGSAVTKERALLEDRLSEWEGIARSSKLLRGLTSQQYESHAARGTIKTGMNREEVIRTWRYPDRVTWVKREKRLFEIWVWEERYACFADGLVFQTEG